MRTTSACMKNWPDGLFQNHERMEAKDLRVLQLGKFYPVYGGVEKVAYDLMAGLSERGVRCDMLCAACEGGTRAVQVNGRASLMACRTLAKVCATMISPAMVSALRGICGRYDIIHVHHPDPMACLALFLSGYKGTVVLHWHSDIQKQHLLLRFYRPLQDWLLRRAAVVVGTTPVYLAESPFLRGVQGKTFCLPIGVEPMRPRPEAVAALRREYAGKKLVFSLGRLVPYKGYEWLVDAAGHLPDDYVVLIGGDGNLKEELRRRISAMRLEGKVRLLGRVSDEDLPAYYGACDVFCLSSVMKTEAFGIVQIEAMSCGKPVVATEIPQSGVSWVNRHGTSGLNVPCRDAEALARAIREITADGETYRRYSSGAEARYREWFTKERMIDQCLTLYSEIYEKRGRECIFQSGTDAHGGRQL